MTSLIFKIDKEKNKMMINVWDKDERTSEERDGRNKKVKTMMNQIKSA